MTSKTKGIARAGVCAILVAVVLGAGGAPAWSSDKEQKRLLKGEPVAGSEQRPSGKRWMKARILIKAPPQVVWDTVHEERKTDPDLAYSKILSQSKNSATLEQKFVLLPVIGTAVCVMSNEEVPLERIDYKLIKSDHFKAMEGSWVLTPHEDGKSTILELSTYVDIGYNVPRSLMDAVTSRKLQRRVQHVKEMSEKNHERLAAISAAPR